MAINYVEVRLSKKSRGSDESEGQIDKLIRKRDEEPRGGE